MAFPELSLPITQCLLSHQMGQLKLTPLELSKTLDIPSSLWNQIPSSLQSKVLVDLDLFPTKCSIALLDALLTRNDNEETLTHSHMSLPATLPPNEPIGPDIKAITKSDDASISVLLWNDRVHSNQIKRRTELLDFLRQVTLCWYRKKIRQELLLWFQAQYSSLFIKSTSYYINSCQYKTTLKVSRIMHRTSARVRVDWLAGQECVEQCSNTVITALGLYFGVGILNITRSSSEMVYLYGIHPLSYIKDPTMTGTRFRSS